MNISLMDHFSSLEDPRQCWKATYPLEEILLTVLCATMSGADDFVDITPRLLKQFPEYLLTDSPLKRCFSILLP